MQSSIPFDFIPFDFADKAILLAYFNEEQIEELRNFGLAFFDINPNITFQVTLYDIGVTGLLLNITQNAVTDLCLLPFAEALTQRDDLQQQYILLIQKSAKILGKASIELKKRAFILVEKYHVTTNMVRLVLQSEQDLSHLPTGYAFLFNTEILTLESRRAVRYYTLRKAWQQTTSQENKENLAWVDVYCHGEKNGAISLGERWIKSLKPGDIVTSEREFPEKIDHLATGQTLLIADETSLPTVARLLETWKNALPPILITFVQGDNEVAYLQAVIKDNFAPASITILPVIADKSALAPEQIFETLCRFLQRHPLSIDKVWGGLEATTTKQLRPLLLNFSGLTRDNMVLKVYWRMQ